MTAFACDFSRNEDQAFACEFSRNEDQAFACDFSRNEDQSAILFRQTWKLTHLNHSASIANKAEIDFELYYTRVIKSLHE
jgi:hypothetical protein